MFIESQCGVDIPGIIQRQRDPMQSAMPDVAAVGDDQFHLLQAELAPIPHPESDHADEG